MPVESDTLILAIRRRMDELSQRTLFVSHLPKSILLKSMATLFKKSINARFPKKKIRGNRKYVFVEFASQDDANAALSKAGDLKIGGKPIKAEICSQRMTEALLRCTTENELKDLFPGAKSIDLPNAGPGKSIGYAQVDFPSHEAALEAFKSKHGVKVHGSPIVVNFAIRTRMTSQKKSNINEKNPTSATISNVSSQPSKTQPEDKDSDIPKATETRKRQLEENQRGKNNTTAAKKERTSETSINTPKAAAKRRRPVKSPNPVK